MSFQLTERAVSSLMRGEEVDKPVFQILGFKKIAGQGGNDRYRLNISDGTHSHTFAMLATQLNHMIPEGQLDNFSVIRAEKIISNAVSEKRVLIILDLTILAPGNTVKCKIGNPIAWSEVLSAGNGAGAGASSNRPVRVPVQSQISTSGRFADRPSNNNNEMSTYQPQHSYGANLSGVGIGPTIPIRDLNPYNNNKLAIKARVTNKGPIKTWSNSRGDGKLFSMDLLDESGEIRITAFKEAVDQHYDIIKAGDVYIIKNFIVKSANKQFSTLNHDYELSFNNDTQVIPCTDSEATEIPVVSYDFMEVAFIEGAEKDRIIDVVGVCKKRGELQTFTTKTTNKELTKRDITLVDKTNREINLTIWGKQAQDFVDDSNPVIAVKGAKVSDFNGKSLSLLQSSAFMINPDIPEAHILRGWYDNEGMNVDSLSLSVSRAQGGGIQWKILREANTVENAAAQDKGDFYMSKVTVMAIKRDNAMYKACPEATCNKKVVDGNNGLYRCEKCSKEFPDFKWRAMLNVNFADASDFIWATCFQESAELLLGHKSEVLGSIYNEEADGFDAVIKEAVFKNYIVKLKSKVENYNNENRLKHTTMDLHPVNFAEYARKLLNEIKECTTL